MSYVRCLPACFLLLAMQANAQKPFTEGVAIYHVAVTGAGDNGKVSYQGTYICTVKGGQIRKDLKLDNGYRDVVLYNINTGAVYSLQTDGNKKYAIQSDLEDYKKRQAPYEHYKLSEDKDDERSIAGCKVRTALVSYTDSPAIQLNYTTDWYPTDQILFERFPGAKFFPLTFTYAYGNGSAMSFTAERIDAKPVENAIFALPHDYKIISYNEYKELNK